MHDHVFEILANPMQNVRRNTLQNGIVFEETIFLDCSLILERLLCVLGCVWGLFGNALDGVWGVFGHALGMFWGQNLVTTRLEY